MGRCCVGVDLNRNWNISFEGKRYEFYSNALFNGPCWKGLVQSGKSGTIRESNQASGVRKAHYA